MAYVRKTTDEWHILIDYGYGDGWEHECTELNFRDKNETVKAYRENCPGIRIKSKKVRVKKEQDDA